MDTTSIIAKKVAGIAHDLLMQNRDGEALDGDNTELFCKELLKELDELNGNV